MFKLNRGLIGAAMGLVLTQSGAVKMVHTGTPDIRDVFIPGPNFIAARYHNGYWGNGRNPSGVRAAKRAKHKRKGIAQAKANGCYRSGR